MSAKMGNFSKSLSHMETPLKVVRCSQSLCGVPYFRSPTGDVVVVVVDVAPIWMLTPHNVLVASLPSYDGWHFTTVNKHSHLRYASVCKFQRGK